MEVPKVPLGQAVQTLAPPVLYLPALQGSPVGDALPAGHSNPGAQGPKHAAVAIPGTDE